MTTFTELEQRSLVLRRVAALLRSGRAHHEALGLAADGLPPGDLRARVEASRRALEAGEPPPKGGLPAPDAPPEAFEAAAAAVDARLEASAAIAGARVFFFAGVVLPLLLLIGFAWSLPTQTVVAFEADMGPVTVFQRFGRLVAPVLLVGALAAVGRVARWVPGRAHLERAEVLFEAASRGALPAGGLQGDLEHTWFALRSPTLGTGGALRGFAEVLVARGRARVALARSLSGPGGLLLGLGMGWITWLVLFSVVLRTSSALLG